MTIVQTIQELAQYLKQQLASDRDYLQYKSTANPDEYETSVPAIYCFTVPSSAIVDTYPAKCPSICITLNGRDDYKYSVTINLCISSVSRSSKEIASPTSISNIYTFNAEDNTYSTESDDDLIIESILFTDQIYNYIMNYVAVEISELIVEYPDVSLPDFPYAISAVSFKLAANQDHIGQNPFSDYY